MNRFKRFSILMCGLAALFLSHNSCPADEYVDVQFHPKNGLPPFEYMEAPGPLPNYTPNASWGTQGEPISIMQKPLPAEESARHIVTFSDFDVHLFASEPDIVKPLWLAFDHRGRLWIAESIDYPNQLQSPGEGRDRLRILEDTDGDGRADKFTVFADKLSIPTSFIFANGGVIVLHSGHTELLRDLDGDDVADERVTLFTGWDMRDTHATASNLRYGFDNWIWGTVGYSGFRGTVGGKNIQFGQGIFRFKPDGSELEFIRSSNNNTWGLGITEDNIIIGSTANGNASMYMPIPNRFYEQVNGWSAARLESIADSQNFYPITEKVRQVDWHGRYTAGSGSAIYTARSFPREFWNRAQFVAEPTGHLLGLFFLDRTGADFRAHNSRNFLASDDEWTSPIYGEVGPDGALWVVDWYNYIIQHNPTPKGFDNGKGNAYETPIRDKSHGRIYRVTHRGGHESIQPTLSTDQPDNLVSALQNDNLLWRLHAQRLLIERNKTDVVPALIRLASGTILDDINLAPGTIHSLWVLKGLGILDSGNASAIQVTVDALKHPSAAVRRAAAMVLPRNRATLNALLDAGILNDEDAQVRLAALLALSELPSDAGVGQSILDMLQEPRNANDKWIADAAVSAAAQNDSAFLNAYLSHARGNQSISNAENSRQGLQRVVETVTQHYARRGPTDSIVSTLAALNGVSPNVATSVLDGLKDGWPGDISPELSISEKQQLEKVMDSLPEIVRDRLLSLGEQWKVPGLFEGRMAAIVASLRGQVADEKTSDAQRSAAAKRWIMLEDSTSVVENVLSHISLLSSPDLSSGLVSALSESRKNETATIILKHWATFTPAVRRSAISVLLRRSEWALAMLDSVEDMSISRMDIPNEYWSQLRQNPNRRVAGRANRLSSASASISADRAEIVNKLLPLAKEKGDAAAGKAVFEAYCFVCHAFNGSGGQVVPDLTGIGSRDRSDILLEILDPNRSVEANYRLWNVTTVDGNTFSGRLDAETQTTVEIMDVASQKHVIQRKEIESLEASQMSIMPVGFESIPPDDLKALLEYLGQPH